NRPYVLTGVSAESGGFRRDVNPVLTGFDYSAGLTQGDVFARLVLPRPHEILSLRATKNPIVANDPFGFVNGKNFPGIHVIRYASADLTQVQLGNHVLPETPGN